MADQVVVADALTVGPLAVTLSDPDTALATLSFAATSSNALLIPNGNVIVGGSGGSRTITLGILPGVIGSTVITMTAGDGSAVATRTFTVTVSPPPPPPPPPAPSPAPPPPPPPPAVVPPGAPSALTATVRDTIVELSWVAAPASDEPQFEPPADGPQPDAARGYRIDVGTGAGRSDAATFTTGVTTSFSVTGLLPGTYFIRVRAFNSGGDGPASNEVAATIVDRSAPRHLRASLSGRSLRLSWDAPDDLLPVLGYVVEAGSAPGQSDIGVVPTPGLAMTLESVPDGTYFIRVKALRAGGAGAASNEVTVRVGAAPLPCTVAPGAPVLSGGASGTVAVVSWVASLAGGPPTSYVMQAGSGPGQSNLASLTLDSAVTSFSSPAPDGTYFIRVIAVNACGSSPASNELTITIGVPPPPAGPAPGAPSSLTAQVVGSQVTLTWAPPVSGGMATRYIIEVSDLAGHPIVTIDTGNPATTFSQSGVPSGVAFAVRVRGANAGGVGPPSATVTVAIP